MHRDLLKRLDLHFIISMMQPAIKDHPRLLRSTGFRIGLLLLALAAMAAVGLMLTTAREQVQTRGEKNLGVAVLFMFWLPILFLAVPGVCFLLGSALVFVYRRWKNP